MTPADEALFITLWQQGASQQELATRLAVPIGTVKSRASALARQGKIQARPKGGAYPRQRHQAALPGVSSDTPGVRHDTPQVSAGVSARTPMPAERGKSIRWNLHLSEGLRARIKSMAASRGLQDSQMVEESLWLALSVVEEADHA